MRWRFSRTVVIGLVTLSLSGCGFTPLYANQGVVQGLENVQVVLGEHSRDGFLVVEQLNDQLGRHHTDGALKLGLKVYSRRVPRGVRVNNIANRYELTMTVVYELSDAATTHVLTHDQFEVSATYDSADQPYAGVAAEQDGEQRAAGLAADQLRLRLARFFAQHGHTP